MGSGGDTLVGAKLDYFFENAEYIGSKYRKIIPPVGYGRG